MHFGMDIHSRRAALMGIAAVGAFSGCSQQQKQTKDDRMNIIYIMTDDHAFQAISAYDHPLSRLAPTPNIDRLAKAGIRFDRAYVENSLSTPSRACLMTGLYSHQNGQTMLSNVMDSTVTFIPELMHEAGYQTAVVGKWHMKCEPRGFDTFHVLNDQGEYYNPGFKSPETDGQYVSEPGYATELITDHAIDFLESRDPDKPFLLYVHHKAPHRTWQPDLKYLELYEDLEFPLPETFYDDYATRGRAVQEQRMRIDEHMTMVGDLKLYGYEETVPNYYPQMPGMLPRQPVDPRRAPRGLASMTDEQLDVWYDSYNRRNQIFFDNQDRMSHDDIVRWKYQRYVKDYLRVIKSVDDSVGEILDYLEAHGLMDNTMVVYTSDQGFYMGEHGWFDKRFMYEESFRTPLLIHYPGNKGGAVSETLVQNLDFGPTFLDIAGVQQPSDMFGLSLVPVLKKEGKRPRKWRDALYYHFYDHTPEHNVMRHDGVFDSRYKLVHFYDEKGVIPAYEEFYDLESDPDELNNLVGNKDYEVLVAKYMKMLSEKRSAVGVTEF